MNKYDFTLSPAYSIWNGVAISEQNGCTISFMTADLKNKILCERLKNAFFKHVSYVLTQKDCPASFRRIPKVEFIEGSREEIRELLISEEQSAGILIFDKVIWKAKEKNISEIHIFSDSVFFKESGKLIKQFHLNKADAKNFENRLLELSGVTSVNYRLPQTKSFIYGSADSTYIEVSTIPTIIDGENQNCSNYTLRIIDFSNLPVKADDFGFTEEQLTQIHTFSQESPKLTVICERNNPLRKELISSLLLSIKTQNENNLKIISTEKTPSYFIPGVIYADHQNIRSKDEFDFYLSIFRQNPDIIIVGDILDKKTYLFCLAALKRGISILSSVPSINLDTMILDFDMLGIPLQEIFSYDNNFICVEKNPESENQKILIDLAVSKALETKLPPEYNYNSYLLHYTNYSQILSENMKMIFDRKRSSLIPGKNISDTVQPVFQSKTRTEEINEA